MVDWTQELTNDELRLGRLAAKNTEARYGALRAHVSAEVWQDLVLASMASLILGQALEDKFGAAQRLIRAALEVAQGRGTKVFKR